MQLTDQPYQQAAPSALKSFLRLETGAIVTLRMRGHTHSPGGLEYFAPAVVLAQYNDPYGSIDALVWDSTAGTHMATGYHVRELGARGDGGEREMYELQSNIGEVLFSPDRFKEVIEQHYILHTQITALQKRVGALESAHAVSNAKVPEQAMPPKAASEAKRT